MSLLDNLTKFEGNIAIAPAAGMYHVGKWQRCSVVGSGLTGVVVQFYQAKEPEDPTAFEVVRFLALAIVDGSRRFEPLRAFLSKGLEGKNLRPLGHPKLGANMYTIETETLDKADGFEYIGASFTGGDNEATEAALVFHNH